MAERKYTAKKFRTAVEAYFASISYMEPVMERVPEVETDAQGVLRQKRDGYGHQCYMMRPVITADGMPAQRIRYISPPSVTGICLRLGISRETWGQYAKRVGYADTVTRARGRIEDYLLEQLEHKESARGAIFNLQNNFGWKNREEKSLDEGTQRAVATVGMSLGEKRELLKSMGLHMPGEEENYDEQTGH